MNAATRKALLRWFASAGRDLPWRKRTDAYAVMVSEFMLQQTQVATVIPYFERWMLRFPDFRSLAAAQESEVMHAWQGLGYYSRARNLHSAAKQVVAEHGGELPPDLQAIARLPGVGRYTAGAITSFAFDIPAAAVDANIARVLARMYEVRVPVDSTEGSQTLWAHAHALLPKTGGRAHTSALMELGALVCIPRKPRCAECPIGTVCKTPDPESLPLKKPRPKTLRIQENCAWILAGGNLLLEKQSGPQWRGLWKLPPASPPPGQIPLMELEYPFTNHIVSLRVFGQKPPEPLPFGTQWWRLTDLDGAALAAGHRRALGILLTKT